MVAYPGAQTLDVVGPLETFALTNAQFPAAGRHTGPPYSIEIVAAEAGRVRMASGIGLVADRSWLSLRDGIDTLIVAGGIVHDAARDPHLRRWLQRQARSVRRLASVCSGAFILAEAGLLDGRRATTHWIAADRLARRFPKIDVDPDALFVRDGKVYTSAGITAGMDLALAMVEEDHGHEIALAVARHMVLFLKRPGGQSQFSRQLAAQMIPVGALDRLPEWIFDRLHEDLGVESLAARCAMSPRNFARVFTRVTGQTPAKFVERARIERARQLLEDSDASLHEVADRCGFGNAERMRRTFQRHLGVVPHDYRRRFRRETATPVALHA
jgi:transcriptional regulator GlxA family with amidase domain